MVRPKCGCCGGPLDIWHDEDTEEPYLFCNNPQPIHTDEQFWAYLANLPGDEVAYLAREYDLG